MAWDITTARIKAGLTAGDVSKDNELQLAMDTALALVETYCDRYFLYQDQREEFTHVERSVSLKRYPVETLTNIVGTTAGKLNKDAGILGIATTNSMIVDYKGGYKKLPLDIELALWGVFSTTYSNLTAVGGGGVSGEVKKLAITGVGSIDYESASASSDSHSAFGGLLPSTSKNILDHYVRKLI